MEKYVTLEEYKEMWTTARMFASQSNDPVPRCYVEGIMLPLETDKIVENLKKWEVREDDLWIVTYPKTGTTWVQEIVSCLVHDGDIDEVNKRHTAFRVPHIDQHLVKELRETKNLPETYKIIEEMPSPRVIKSHLPGHLLPPQLMEKNPKIIYVLRNPKDVVVSFFHFLKIVSLSPSILAVTFDEFFQQMLAGKMFYGPWWDHYLYFWKRRHAPNILLLNFEDMKKDSRGHVEKIAAFIDKNLPAEKIDAITEHCTFDNMKKNHMTNLGYIYCKQDNSQNFMRKGKVGDWRNHFTVAQNEAMDALIREKLHGTGLRFDDN